LKGTSSNSPSSSFSKTLPLDATNDDGGETVIKRSDRGQVIGAAIPSGAIITVIGGSSAGYIGIGGGVFTPDILRKSILIPVNWKMVF
jgi:hypothetical protein